MPQSPESRLPVSSLSASVVHLRWPQRRTFRQSERRHSLFPAVSTLCRSPQSAVAGEAWASVEVTAPWFRRHCASCRIKFFPCSLAEVARRIVRQMVPRAVAQHRLIPRLPTGSSPVAEADPLPCRTARAAMVLLPTPRREELETQASISVVRVAQMGSEGAVRRA